MSEAPKNPRTSRCTCGSVTYEAGGAPILSAACYCDDCQEGARQIEALPNAPPVQDLDGGTEYVLFRKDRVWCMKGAQLLKRYKIREKSPTNRVVATCCNTAMVLDFDDSKHWISMYRTRFQGDVPPLEVRVCTKFKRGNRQLPDDVPSHPSFPVKFIGKLIGARVAMLFGQ